MTEVAVPLDFVREHDLPKYCALTGEPTRSSYGLTLFSGRIWMPVIALSFLLGLIVMYVFCDPVTVRVPLARRLRWRRALCGWLMIPVGIAAGTLVLLALVEPGWQSMAGAAVGSGAFAQLGWTYRRSSARILRRGEVVTMRVHPVLASALRDRTTFPPVPPGWLPDPTGQAVERWWDGAHWTDDVRARA